jgi:hypothetical protein
VLAPSPFATTAPLPTNNLFGQNVALVTVSLDPPIAVQAGDVIAVTNMAPAECGGPNASRVFNGDTAGLVYGDFTSGTPNLEIKTSVALRASSAPQTLVGIVPVVGSVAGVAGSLASARSTNVLSKMGVSARPLAG